MSTTTPAWWRRPGVRARGADLLYLAVGALVTVALTAETVHEQGAVAGVAAALSCVLGLGALLLRRRHPLLVVVLAVPSMLLAYDTLGVFPLALLAFAVRRRDRVLAFVGVGGWALSVAASVLHGRSWASDAISNALLLGLATAVGAYVGARRDLLASLRARADQAEAELALRSDQARLAERTRIAQEMHDVLAHRISLIGLHAGGLEVTPDAGPEVVERSAALIRQTARAALEDLRGVLGVLRADGSPDGAELAPQPLLQDLPRLVASSMSAGVAVTLLDTLPAGAAVPDVTGRTVYRVVQEALTNVHKHARHAATTVTLAGSPGGELAVEVENVRPVSAETLLPGAGVGLVGLRERVELAGGRLEAGATASGGWRVAAWFPWPTP